MNDQPIQGVLIGAGYFAGIQAEAWMRIAGVELAAVVDPLPGKARGFAERFGIARAYESVAEALGREQPDFVDIVTRPESHLPLTRCAAEGGIHVICQKPMAPTWDECRAMVGACEQARVRLWIHENWRWQPWYREIKRLLDDHRLGRLFQLTFVWRTGDGCGPEPYVLQPYFRQMPRLLVYESLVHLLDTFRYLAGEFESLNCQLARVNSRIAGEDQALIQLQFVSGVLGIIDANRISGPAVAPVAMGSLVVEGDRGMLRMSPDGQLWLTEHGRPEQRLPFEPPTGGYKGDSVFATQNHILHSLRTGDSSENDGLDYLQTVAAVFACYESAEKRQSVRLR